MSTTALISSDGGLLSDHSNPVFRETEHLNEEVAYILSQHYYGECLAAELAAKMEQSINDSTPQDWADMIRSLAQEEAMHASLLKSFLERRLGGVRPVSEHIRPMVEVGLAMPNPGYAFLGVHLVIEPLGVRSLLHLRRYCQDAELTDLIALLLRDEGKHMGYLSVLESTHGPLSPTVALEWAKLCITAMRWQSCPFAMLTTKYGNEEGRILYDEAMRGRTLSGVAQKGASILCKQLRHIKGMALPMKELLEAFTRDFREQDFTELLERECA